MAYKIETQYNSPNFTPGNQANAVWGLGNRRVESITIHWWNAPGKGDTYEGTIAYLSRPGGITSAHVVAEAGRAAWIVDAANSAWHAGNARGNTTSIGIECNPRASDADYQTIAELIRDIRSVYGNIPLIPHRDWQATQCPGHYDLARLDRLARSGSSAPAPAPAPAPKPTPPSPLPTVPSNGIYNLKVTADVAWVRTAPRVAPRVAPRTADNLVAEYPKGIARGATLAVVGYVKGDDPFDDGVQDDAWLKTKSGYYVWANNVNDNSVAGLPYLGDMSSKPAPAPAAPAPLLVRRVTNPVAWVRTAARSNAPLAPGYPNGLANGAVLSVKGYVAGQDPYGTGDNAWYVTKSGYYVWANAAGNSLAGLPQL